MIPDFIDSLILPSTFGIWVSQDILGEMLTCGVKSKFLSLVFKVLKDLALYLSVSTFTLSWEV